MPAPAATEAAIQRAIRAAQACHLQVTGFTVGKDGSVRVDTAPAAPVESLDRPTADVRPLTPKRWASR